MHSRSRGRTIALSLAGTAALLSMGCGATVLSQLTPEVQPRYRGTEPGRHVLSPHFVIEIKSNGRATFFHVPDPRDPERRTKLGAQDMFWPPGSFEVSGVMREVYRCRFGPRENAYAISPEGRSLLYFKEGGLLTPGPGHPKHPFEFGASLHLYRHGLGDSLILASVTHWVHPRDQDPPVPTDGVRCALADTHGHPGWRGLWTRGETVVRRIREFEPR